MSETTTVTPEDVTTEVEVKTEIETPKVEVKKTTPPPKKVATKKASSIDAIDFYPLDPTVVFPTMATEGSACFDLRAWFSEDLNSIDGYDDLNKRLQFLVRRTPNAKSGVLLRPSMRMAIPTGLIPVIPEGKKLVILSRSGMALKEGLVVLNAPGIIDRDYRDQIYIIVKNTTAARVMIEDGDRIAQCEMVDAYDKSTLRIRRLTEKPKPILDRKGGLGSTEKA